MSVLAADLGEPEAPVLLEDGSWLCVEMRADRGWVVQLGADGHGKRVLAVTGRPNGLAVDRTGAIWVAESRTPCLLRMDRDGRIDLRLDEVEGRPMLFPNDIAIAPDGVLWVTDSGMPNHEFAPGGEMRPDALVASYDGRVYRVDPQTHAVTQHDEGIRFTNGIAWGPDGLLYVNETATGDVFRYRPTGDGLGPRQVFANVRDDSGPGWRGGDGMKFGRDGHLYCTVFGQGDVTVIGPDGGVVDRIPLTGAQPTNLAFGPAGSRRIYVTEVEHGRMEVHDVPTDGLPLHG